MATQIGIWGLLVLKHPSTHACVGVSARLHSYAHPDAARRSHFVNLLHMSEAIFRGMQRSSAILRDAAQFRHCVDFCTCQRPFFEGCSALQQFVNLLHMSEAIFRGLEGCSAVQPLCELTAHVRGHFSRDAAQFSHLVNLLHTQRPFAEGCSAVQPLCELTAHVRSHFVKAQRTDGAVCAARSGCSRRYTDRQKRSGPAEHAATAR